MLSKIIKFLTDPNTYQSEEDELLQNYYVRNEFEDFCDQFPKESRYKLKKQFFTSTKKKELREKLERIRQQEERKAKEERAKRIKIRIFAYDYEDFLFSVFAPYAYKISERSNNYFSRKVSKDYLIQKIKECPQFCGKNPEDVISLLLENGLLFSTDKLKFELGTVLESYGDIVSDYDMTFNKWIEMHKEKGEG